MDLKIRKSDNDITISMNKEIEGSWFRYSIVMENNKKTEVIADQLADYLKVLTGLTENLMLVNQ